MTRQGEISVASLGILPAQLYGCMMALLASLAVCVIGCFVAPMNFNWKIMVDGITLVPGDGAHWTLERKPLALVAQLLTS